MNKLKLRAIEEYVPIYWEGRQNILIRLWTYTKIGLQQINEFKYVAAAIFGIYYTFKLANPFWLIVMFFISIPCLILIGRWWLHRGAKTAEWVNTHFGSVIGYNSYNLQIKQTELLEKILKKLTK